MKRPMVFKLGGTCHLEIMPHHICCIGKVNFKQGGVGRSHCCAMQDLNKISVSRRDTKALFYFSYSGERNTQTLLCWGSRIFYCRGKKKNHSI